MQDRGTKRRITNKAPVWSIGIFAGPKLDVLKPTNEMPVLSAEQVTDIPAEFVADPFMIQVGNTWHMFFEVMNAETGRGEIGLAKSVDGIRWDYQQIVLSESFHLSYPYVFGADDEYFMIPESHEENAIKLYRAVSFPMNWEPVKTILEGGWVDSSVLFFNDLWWLFTNPVAPSNQILELFYAASITGPWHRHPMSPLVNSNHRIARGGGRLVVQDDRPVRFAQDCFPSYGTSVRAFEITVLDTSVYAERELEGSPILGPGSLPWNQSGMHHIDAHLTSNGWLACVDGWRP
jgi:beta-xylosidase